jgi:MFS family permease
VLCSAVFQPIFASMTAFGHKTSIIIALTFFACGSLVCALARSVAMLIAGRCLQGIGGGGLIILTYVIMAHLFTLQERSKYTSIIGLIWTVGTVFGPLIGGGFAQINWVSSTNCDCCHSSCLHPLAWHFLVESATCRYVPRACS